MNACKCVCVRACATMGKLYDRGGRNGWAHNMYVGIARAETPSETSNIMYYRKLCELRSLVLVVLT